MAIWFLSAGGSPDTSRNVTLEGLSYTFRFRWLERDESWKVSIGFTGKTPAISFKATNGLNLLSNYKNILGVPSGELYVFDTINQFGRVDYDNIGLDKDFRVLYKESE